MRHDSVNSGIPVLKPLPVRKWSPGAEDSAHDAAAHQYAELSERVLSWLHTIHEDSRTVEASDLSWLDIVHKDLQPVEACVLSWFEPMPKDSQPVEVQFGDTRDFTGSEIRALVARSCAPNGCPMAPSLSDLIDLGARHCNSWENDDDAVSVNSLPALDVPSSGTQSSGCTIIEDASHVSDGTSFEEDRSDVSDGTLFEEDRSDKSGDEAPAKM